MNTKRLLIAWVVAFLATAVYQTALFHLGGLDEVHRQHSDMLRPDAGELRMTLVMALTWALIAVLYAWIVRGRPSNIRNGLIFGILMGFIAGWIPQAWMQLLIANWPFYPWWAAAHFGEYVLGGIILGAIYRE